MAKSGYFSTNAGDEKQITLTKLPTADKQILSTSQNLLEHK